MIILYTTSSYPTSWLIRKITKEDCSHVALYFDSTQQVVHCNFLGVQLVPLVEFIKHNQIIHSTPSYNNRTAVGVYKQYKDVKYDFGALLYLGLRYICRGLPKANLWQTTGLFMCTEFVTAALGEHPDSMITPHKLFEKLKPLTNKKA